VRSPSVLPSLTGPTLVSALGGVTLFVGAVATLALAFGTSAGLEAPGAPAMAAIAAGWRHLCGWAAWPIALGLVWAGGGLLWLRHTDPWQLPWGRVLAIEMALAAALALSAAAWGPHSPEGSGEGGEIGWALATTATRLLGPVPAALLWLAIGSAGVLGAFKIGARAIAEQLNTLADSLAAAPLASPPNDPSLPPGAKPVVAGPGSSAVADPQARAPAAGQQAPLPSAASPPPPGRAEPAQARRSAPSRVPKLPATVQASEGTPPSAGQAAQPPLPGYPPAAAAGTRKPARGERGARYRPPAGLPGLDLLHAQVPSGKRPEDSVAQVAMAETIARTLSSFGAPADVVAIEPGPSFTRYGLKPGTVMRAGQPRRVAVARIVALRHDLALALAVPAIRIEAPVPGRALVGIEVPNPQTEPVGLRDVIESPPFARARKRSGLAIALGRDVTGETVAADLAAMPHLLIAGTTGSGKSICLNVILASLLFQSTPDALSLLLIDPKRVEMIGYNGLPHLIAPVVTDWREAVGALRWLVGQMDDRFTRFAARGVRDRAAFNSRSPAGEAPVPALVVIIDELADLMLTAGEEVEPLVTRIAQLGRAAGIHLIVATQRPSTDVVTGLIKANFPARIAFAVASGIDSRVILDRTGAEALLGRGDMLFQAPDAPDPRRLQGALVTDAEIAALVAFWKGSHWQGPRRLPPWDDLVPSDDPDAALYARAQEIALDTPQVSASLLQRRLRVGYAKARALHDRLVDDGLVGVDADPAHDGQAEDDFDADRDRYTRPSERDLGWVDSEFDRG
jgi:S-DNA-T family DNA segregation ATPase FtsK/SpoIIIE